MDKETPSQTKLHAYLTSTYTRLWILFLAYFFLIAARLISKRFGFSLGYFYVVLITLASFWFGGKGGITAAIISSLTFITEINIFKSWPYRDLVTEGLIFRISVYLSSGLIMGYLSEIDRNLKQRLRALAYSDELTGCVNYRWTMQLLEKEISRSKRYQKEVTIVMIDLDHFKKINDAYGHLVGNEVLKSFAEVLKKNTRNVDIVGRYGGEEFLIVLPETSSKMAFTVLERIKEELLKLQIWSNRRKRNLVLSLQFSAGIATFPLNANDVETLMNAADSSLYRAKRSGRDQVLVERRRWARAEPAKGLQVEILDETGKEPIKAKDVKDVSRRGFLLIFEKDIPKGDFICRLRFPEEVQAAEFKCRVVHSEKTKADLFRVGVYVVEMPLRMEDKWLNFIEPDIEKNKDESAA